MYIGALKKRAYEEEVGGYESREPLALKLFLVIFQLFAFDLSGHLDIDFCSYIGIDV